LIINSKYTKNNPLFRLLLKLFLRKKKYCLSRIGVERVELSSSEFIIKYLF